MKRWAYKNLRSKIWEREVSQKNIVEEEIEKWKIIVEEFC